LLVFGSAPLESALLVQYYLALGVELDVGLETDDDFVGGHTGILSGQ